MISIWGVYERGGSVPTTAFEYSMGAAGHTGAHYSLTKTIDPSRTPATIDASLFIDGYGRLLQSKREHVIDNGPGLTVPGMLVSGPIERDSLGRVTRRWQTFFEPGGVLTARAAEVRRNPTTVSFDRLGHVQVLTAANTTDTLTYNYGFIVSHP